MIAGAAALVAGAFALVVTAMVGMVAALIYFLRGRHAGRIEVRSRSSHHGKHVVEGEYKVLDDDKGHDREEK